MPIGSVGGAGGLNQAGRGALGTPAGLSSLLSGGYRGANPVTSIGRGNIDFSGFPGAQNGLGGLLSNSAGTPIGQTPTGGGRPNWTTANTPAGTLIEGGPANTGNEPIRSPTAPAIPQVNMPLSDAQFAAASAMGNSPGVTITPGVTPFNAPQGAGNSQGTPGIQNLPQYIMGQNGQWSPNNAAGTAAGVPGSFNSFPDYTAADYARFGVPVTNPNVR